MQSIAAQTVPPDVLILSWYADESLADAVVAALRKARLPLRVRYLRQRRRLSQYGHLREALAAFEHEAPRDAAALPFQTTTWRAAAAQRSRYSVACGVRSHTGGVPTVSRT